MKPCSRHLLDDWLRRAYKLANVLPQRRGMWHSIRRKWATERKGYPVKDVAAAGGWKTEEVLVTSYQQVDAETIKNVVLHPAHRMVSRRNSQHYSQHGGVRRKSPTSEVDVRLDLHSVGTAGFEPATP